MITYGSTTLTSYNTITKIEVYYYQSTSPTTQTGGSWSTTKPTWVDGRYVWQKIRTTYEGKLDNGSYYSESDPVNITGQQGATGTAAYSYKLNSSDSIIGKTKDGEYTIKKITFSATYKQGTGAVSAYNGRFKIESTTNGSTWKTEYTSSGNEASKEFTIPDDIIAIKCSLYQNSGSTVLLDIVTVPVVKDGVDAIGLRDSIPYYLASDKDTGITRLTQGWTRYRPQLTAEKKYLWVYYVSRYSEGSTEPELIEIKDDLVHFVNNGDEAPVESCVVDIEPVQDLHGYDSPWPAGGGKNKLPNNAVTSTIQGVTYTVNNDGTINVNGTSTGWTGLYIGTVTLPAGNYVISSGVTSGYANIYLELSGAKVTNTNSSGGQNSFTLSESGEVTCKLFARPNNVISNVVVSPMIRLAAETDSTYAPYSNICPITGWTGAKVTRTGKNLASLTFGSRVPSILNGQMVDYYGRSSDYIAVKNTANFIASTIAVDSRYILFYDANKNYLGYNAMWSQSGYLLRNDTHWNDTAYIKFRIDTRESEEPNIQLELGSTATAYEPYSGDTYDITFPTEAGTVYGGTLDVTKGELVVNRAMMNLGAWNWTMYSVSQGNLFRTPSVVNAVLQYDGLNIICSNYPTVKASQRQDKTMSIGSNNRVDIIDSNYSDASAFKTAMNGVQLVYELATPQTYRLTPQEITMLCKENNIFADTGQTAISYYDNQTSTDPYVDYSATSAFEYANTAINRATAVYGTCSTDAGTAAKAVTCSNFVLFNGARIQVTFTNANIASAPTLNVNSTGAKAIYINKTITSSSNLLLWTAGSKMEFVYDDTGWIAQNVPYALYGTCSTGASTAAKVVTCNEAVICKGTTISVNMTNTNTAADATMNVGSTLAKDIYANGAKLTTNSRFNWRANTTQKFVFDGQVWRMDDDSVKALATAYITEIDDNGIMVHPEDDDTSGWAISDAIQLFKNGISYIKLWIENNIPKIRIGKEDQGHIVLDNDSVDVRNGDDILASFGETSIIGDQSQWHQTIASDKTSFANGQTEYAYISPDKFYVVNAEVSDAFYIGNYSIRNTKDGKLVIGLRRR